MMKKNSNIKILGKICAAVFGVAFVFCAVNTVHAEEPEIVIYWDATGHEATCDSYTVLDSVDPPIFLKEVFML